CAHGSDCVSGSMGLMPAVRQGGEHIEASHEGLRCRPQCYAFRREHGSFHRPAVPVRLDARRGSLASLPFTKQRGCRPADSALRHVISHR
ncbi:unnamed protein product, partial [Symbiodinium pilosum]